MSVLAIGRGGANSKRNEKKLGLVQNVLSFLRIETAEDFRRTLEKIPDYKIRPETVSHKSTLSSVKNLVELKDYPVKL